MKLKCVILSVMALVLSIQPTGAAITSYIDNVAGFNAATGPLTVEEFEDPDDFRAGLDTGVTTPTPVTFPSTGVVLNVIPPAGAVSTDAAFDDSFGATSGVQSIRYDGKNNLIFEFPEPVQAFSIDITSLFSVSTPATYEVLLDDVVAIEVGSSDTDLPTNAAFNFGLTSDIHFSHVIFRFTEGGSGDFIYLDTLRFGSIVPEPASLTLLGFGGLLLARWRR